MSSWLPCTKGSDAVCTAALGQGACCFLYQVETPNNSPDIVQYAEIELYKEAGVATESGQKSYECATASDIANHVANDKDYKWTDSGTGIQYKGYCDMAMNKVFMAVSTAASVLAVASF